MNFFDYAFQGFWSFVGALVLIIVVLNAGLVLVHQLLEHLQERREQKLEHLERMAELRIKQ